MIYQDHVTFILHALEFLQTAEIFFFFYLIIHPITTQFARPQYIRNLEQQMLLHMLLFKTKKKHRENKTESSKQKRNMKQYRNEGVE